MKRIEQREDIDGSGFFILDHVDTGKVYTGSCSNIRKEVSSIRNVLRLLKHPNSLLQSLYESDSSYKLVYHLTRTKSEACKLEKEYRSNKPSYLLIN